MAGSSNVGLKTDWPWRDEGLTLWGRRDVEDTRLCCILERVLLSKQLNLCYLSLFFLFFFFFHKTSCCALVGQVSQLLGKESCVGLLPQAACALHSSLCTRLWIVFPGPGLLSFPVTGISQSLAGGLWIDRSTCLCLCFYPFLCFPTYSRKELEVFEPGTVRQILF